MNPNILPVDQYECLLREKTERLVTMMQEFAPPAPAVFTSPSCFYRMRAEFRVWHEDEDLYYIMFDPQTKQRIRVDQFPVASQLINKLMVRILEELRPSHQLRHKLFQVDFLTTLSQKALISLIYHKKLDSAWEQEAQSICNKLNNEGFDVQIIGRATKQKICFYHDYVDELLPVSGRKLTYRQVENSFTQPNAAVNIKMLEWALSVTQNAKGDLLELYCGNGNFSLALAANFRYVLATEISKSSVEAAQYNIEKNNIPNVKILRMSAEEFTQALQGVREFNRLKGINLSDYQCETVLVDPPRAGLDDDTLKMVQGYKQIIYISCNPETLYNNLKSLTKTHKITEFALFDQFPYTHHIECGVLLTALAN